MTLLVVFLCVAAIIVGITIVAVIMVIAARGRNRPAAEFPVGQQSYRMTHNGTEVLVRLMAIQRGRGQHDYYTEFRLVWPEADFRLEIYPDKGDARGRNLPGMSSLSGDEAGGGEHFVVQANDVHRAHLFLTDAVQFQINTVYRYGSTHDVYVAISGGVFFVRKADPSAGQQNVDHLMRIVASLHEHALSAVEVGLGMHFQASTSSLEEAMCEICGDAIEDDVVFCSRCQTPHHRDCWEYYGACSIYACGETSYVHSERHIHSLLQPKTVPQPRPRRGSL